MKITFVRSVFFLLSCFCVYIQANSQGTIQRSEGRFLASLDFNPASGIYKASKNRIQNASNLPSFPDEYRESGIKVNGMVRGAVLTMEWWTLFGEPTENYNFQWTTSGRYNVYQEGGAGYTVERNKLAKYPDLLLRFDAIKPLDIKFIIYWKFDSDTYKRIHYSFFAGNQQHSVTTNVEEGLLFEPSGKNPLSVPGIRKGKGENFIDKQYDRYQHYPITSEAKASWLKEFNQTKTINIEMFGVTSARWPVKEMLAIATLFEQYEKGEKKPSPMEIVNEELKKNQGLTAYNNNDFWGEAFENEKIKIYTESIFRNGYSVGKKFNIGKFSVDNVESSLGSSWDWGTTVLHEDFNWNKVDYDNNLFDYILDKNAKNLHFIYGIIAKKYKKILTQVNIPSTGNSISKKEFRVYDYTGNILYRESNPRYSSTKADYILLANTPYVLISWLGFVGGYDGPMYTEGVTLLNLKNLEKITVPKFSNRASDRMPLIYDKKALLKDWDSGTKRFIESLRNEINTHKVIIIIPRYGEKPGRSYFDHAIYGITNDDRFIHIRNNIY